MYRNLILFWCFGILGYLFPLFTSAQEIPLEPIVISSSRLEQKSLRAGESWNYKEIEAYPVYSIPDLLQHFSSVDMRRRSALGIQGDLSIRGSNFEQTLVLLDGINLNDPQTAHHNMDLPITIFDIERVEILRGQASGIYGAGGFGGVLSIFTKKPKDKEIIYQISRGEYNLWGEGISITNLLGNFNYRLSYAYRQSSAYKPETDFIHRNFYGAIVKEIEDKEFNFSLGFMEKDFGASTFYSANFPHQEENTQTRFGMFKIKKGNSQLSLYHRGHDDIYVLDRENPTLYKNIHTSYIYGGQFIDRKEMGFGDLAWGLEFSYDKIDSTRLNKHSREQGAIFLEWEKIYKEKYILNLALRNDCYAGWDEQFSPNLNFGYLINSDFKLRSSIGKAFRIPSYTELYYFDPANIGNPDLVPEYAFSWEIGLDRSLGDNLFSITFFRHKTRDSIDWIKENPQDKWQAKNIGEIFFKGVEFDYRFKKTEQKKKFFSLERFGYSYIESDRKAEFFLSKYVLDHLQHHFVLGFRNLLPFGFNQTWNLNYKERMKESGWFILDSRICKKIFSKDYSIEIFLEGTNLTNANYKEIKDVPMPGRWLVLGLRFEL